MSASVDSIMEQALQLPSDARMDLLERLIVTSSEDTEIEAEQVTVAEARLQEMREGEVKGVSVEAALERTRQRLRTLSAHDFGTAS